MITDRSISVRVPDRYRLVRCLTWDNHSKCTMPLGHSTRSDLLLGLRRSCRLAYQWCKSLSL
jgi:hypothetical protein